MSFFGPAPSTIVVVSLETTTFRAWPSRSSLTFSSFMPTSSEMTCAPVSIAMSCSIALRRSPKPGAFTATDVEGAAHPVHDQRGEASPSTSSATTRSGFPACITFSRTGTSSWTLEIFLLTTRM